MRAEAAPGGFPNCHVVRPVASDPDATWQPSRWLSLPALSDEDDVTGWLQCAPRGAEAHYFFGEVPLAAAREHDPVLDRLARALLLRAPVEWPIVTPPPCGHVRGHVVGSGELELVQRRLGSHWLYSARRR